MAVKVFVTYCGAWGYKPKYEKLKNSILARVSGDIEFDSYPTPTTTGYFEVEVNKQLIHSKKNGDGYVDTDAKLQKIVNVVKEAL